MRMQAWTDRGPANRLVCAPQWKSSAACSFARGRASFRTSEVPRQNKESFPGKSQSFSQVATLAMLRILEEVKAEARPARSR